jgi:hypothetical protein
VGLNSLKSLNLTNGYPNKNNKNKNKNNNNKVKSKPLELRSRVKKLVSPWLISSFFITGAQWSGGGKCTFFFENDLFDPGIGYYTPQISLKKCFFRLSRTQWSIFAIHSDPLGGNSQKWVSTVVRWAETA